MSELHPYVPKVVKQYVGDIDFDTEGYVDWCFHRQLIKNFFCCNFDTV